MKHPLQQAEFVQSVADDTQLPPPGPPEIAFAGRSNAGKSSAINALAGRTRLAFASRTPGRTQQINYFRLRSGALVADLPGYGYAAVPHALKRHWQAFLGRYVASRQSLVGLVVIVDARHGLATPDVTLLSAYLASGRPALVLATKIDKLASSRRRATADAIAHALAAAFPFHATQVTVVPFSATHRIGVEAAETLLSEWLAPFVGASASAHARGAPKEKAPRSRGVPRGPKRPSRGRSPRGHPLREESGRRCRPHR
ncbi:MAG TPA: ribosome biogenesis GTP-binding protein YihA/YsxC [Casimicrobiaceae bacterium]|nr:ribosome biogenesis GTP-binding protein YihA/YsxC [Casimicrobiaceae bacterium]